MANYYPWPTEVRPDFPRLGHVFGTPDAANDNYRKKQVYPVPPAANDNRRGGMRPKSIRAPFRRGAYEPLGVTQTILDAVEALEHTLYSTAAITQLSMAGWTPAGACRTGREDVIGTWTSCARPFSPGIINPGATIPGSRTQIMTMTQDNAVAGRPYLPVRIYTRAAQPNPQPNPWKVQPSVNISDVPWVHPANRPDLLPIVSPSAIPFARPGRALGRMPHYQFGVRVRGNSVRPNPGVRPYRPEPPGRYVKEQKFALAVPGAAATLLSWLTEGLDAFHGVYRALPEWFRYEHRYATGAERAMLLYENFHLVDPAQALWNILSDQGKDRYWAMWGQLTAKANRRRGMPGGLALGPAL